MRGKKAKAEKGLATLAEENKSRGKLVQEELF